MSSDQNKSHVKNCTWYLFQMKLDDASFHAKYVTHYKKIYLHVSFFFFVED